MTTALFIIANEGYQDREYGVPKEILEKAGIHVTTAAKKKGLCHGSMGGTVNAIALSDAVENDFDIIIFVGGPGSAVYQKEGLAHSLVRHALETGKMIGAICLAPTILAYAGVLKGKKATVWNLDGKQEAILATNGATFTNEAVTIDGKIVTANGPMAAEAFANAVLKVLGKAQK
ncbi:DJ-1/PfpI family protein [Candidatus Woesearchaeota archaeon]|nr:DJ-1/PfpI family protein [Candidatus Woesearchaeota archaeon]